MTDQTNTGSGAIAQGQNSTSAGERGIAVGNVSGSTIATGDNPVIKNITVLVNLLSWAQVEGLLPKIEDREDFSSITEAIEGALNSRLNSDLADAVAFAGEIIGDFTLMVKGIEAKKPVRLKTVLSFLLITVESKLKDMGYWEEYSFEDSISLKSTEALYEKHFGSSPIFLLCSTEDSKVSPFDLYVGRRHYTQIYDLQLFNPKQLRIIIAGIVLDLIRIYSDNRISVQFLQEMANLFIQHKPQPTE